MTPATQPEKAERPFNVLFLCTGNSARSILAEALVNHWGAGKFVGYSSGSFPVGNVNPLALRLLEQNKIPTEGLRSKSWDEFAAAHAPPLDLVVTVCDNAAGEVCPVWPGRPVTAHWGLPDPAAVKGSEVEQWKAFQDTFCALERRIKALTGLPVSSLGRRMLEEQVRALGKSCFERKPWFQA